MKGLAKQIIAHAESRGFIFDRTNSKGFHYYRHPSGAEVGISPSLDDRAAGRIRRECDRAAGIEKDRSQKHNPAHIKERHRRQHRSAVERRQRHQRRLEVLVSAKASESDIREAQAAVEAADREVRELEHLMQEPPV